ncbi:hypothetical protein C8A00DRAFT_34295 [Chaetomidium leptoderma]|uniref:DUF7587 domain-containing protein n=1 Tax=Chaetomidium leptoderma TaxID=669021 RepID=A0AAN6ZWK2_9PEZI|nr:hypothetical protein C8A00DRAFT_34295 [Chaetomidium leptoderma]
MASESAPSNTTAAAVDAETKKSLVKVQKVKVASWEVRDCKFWKRPNANVWMVATQTATELARGRRKRVWAKEEDEDLKTMCDRLGVKVPDTTTGRKVGGFAKGQPLRRQPVLTLSTLGGEDRPKDCLPAKAPKLALPSLGQSPFLSVAHSLDKALEVFAALSRKRCRGIKIHVIDTHGKQWDHEKQRMFDVWHLIKRLGLPRRGSWFKTTIFNDECIVEDSIPAECVIRTMEWEDIEREFKKELRGINEAHAARRFYFMQLTQERDRYSDKEWEAMKERKREEDEANKRRYGARTKDFETFNMEA